MQSLVEQLVLFAQNEMYQRDLLVALIAACLGLNVIYAAISNNDWVFELGSVSALNDSVGRSATRAILAFMGGCLIMIGAHLVVNSKSEASSKKSPQSIAPNFEFAETASNPS